MGWRLLLELNVLCRGLRWYIWRFLIKENCLCHEKTLFWIGIAGSGFDSDAVPAWIRNTAFLKGSLSTSWPIHSPSKTTTTKSPLQPASISCKHRAILVFFLYRLRLAVYSIGTVPPIRWCILHLGLVGVSCMTLSLLKQLRPVLGMGH
jgi:hypothetical protein